MTTSLVLRSTVPLAAQLDYILIDGSGSMKSQWWESMAALDGFMGTLRAMNVHSHGIIHVFDSHTIENVQRDSTIDCWPKFYDQPITATWGGTPLYDAINLMGRRLRDLDPTRVSIVIITDGDNNGSATDATTARAILDWCRAKGWMVTFLGADFNNSTQAKLLGATAANSIGVAKAKMAEAGKLLGYKRARHAHGEDNISFSDDEKQQFGGYLNGPSAPSKE